MDPLEVLRATPSEWQLRIAAATVLENDQRERGKGG
jgi:hypothetical protein